MPFCPECRAEYRPGFTTCSTCDVELVDELPEPFDFSDENIKKALEGQDLLPVVRGEFEVLKEIRVFLAENSIASLVLDDPDAPVQPGHPQRVMLVVGSADEEDARRVLGDKFEEMVKEEGLSTDEDLAYDKCPACGHEVSENEEECPECGLFIGKA